MPNDLTGSREFVVETIIKAESFTTDGLIYEKTFQRCRFVESDFFSIRFESCDFIDCTFESVDLSGSIFRHCSLIDCIVSRSNFNHAIFDSCTFKAVRDQTKISSCNFTQAEFISGSHNDRIERTLFEHCSLDFTKFSGFEVFEVNFNDCNLQEASVSRCHSTRIDLRTCSSRGLQLVENDFKEFLTYKEKFIRIIGAAELIGKTDIGVDGTTVVLEKTPSENARGSVINAIDELHTEATEAGKLFEQINSGIILRRIRERYPRTDNHQVSTVAGAVEAQFLRRSPELQLRLNDISLAMLALESDGVLTPEDISILAQVAIAIVSHRPASDIEIGKHVMILTRLASRQPIGRYEIVLNLRETDEFMAIVRLSNALSGVVPDGELALTEVTRGSVRSILSANHKGFVIAILILLKLGVSVKYSDNENFSFAASFGGSLIVTDGKTKFQFNPPQKTIDDGEVERRTRRLRDSGFIPNQPHQLDAVAGETTALALPPVRSLISLAMPHTESSRDFPQTTPRLSEQSGSWQLIP